MDKKYKLSDLALKTSVNKNLYVIIALKDFSDVKAGDVGGFVESEDNLSQTGDCWIYDDAKVYGNAKVSGDAKIHDNAIVCGDSSITGNAIVAGNVKISDNVWIYDNAIIRDYANISGTSSISGASKISGNVRIGGRVQVSGNAQISKNASINGWCNIADNTIITDDACVSGCVDVYNNAIIKEHANVKGYVEIKDNVCISGNTNIHAISPKLTVDYKYGVFISGNAKIFGDVYIKSTNGQIRIMDDVMMFGNVIFHGPQYVSGNAYIYKDNHYKNYTIKHYAVKQRKTTKYKQFVDDIEINITYTCSNKQFNTWINNKFVFGNAEQFLQQLNGFTKSTIIINECKKFIYSV